MNGSLVVLLLFSILVLCSFAKFRTDDKNFDSTSEEDEKRHVKLESDSVPMPCALNESDGYRIYESASENVKSLYKNQRMYQSVDFIQRAHNHYLTFSSLSPFWDLFNALNTFMDMSDPDIDLSNHQHLYQTAEGLRKDGHPDWMIFVGFVDFDFIPIYSIQLSLK